MKENWYMKVFRYFYSIEGKLDDDIHNEIIIFGNNMYMLLMIAMIGSFFASMLLQQDFTGDVTFLAVVITLAKQASLVERLELNKLKVTPTELPKAKKMMTRRTVKEAIIGGIFMVMLLLWLWYTGIPQESGTQADVYFKIAFPGTIAMMLPIMFGVQWFANRKRIKIIEGEKRGGRYGLHT